MLSELLTRSLKSVPEDDQNRHFWDAAARWNYETPAMSSVHQSRASFSYTVMREMGEAAIPKIIAAFDFMPCPFWIVLLRDIVGEGPDAFDPENFEAGDISGIEDSWRRWANARGIAPCPPPALGPMPPTWLQEFIRIHFGAEGVRPAATLSNDQP